MKIMEVFLSLEKNIQQAEEKLHELKALTRDTNELQEVLVGLRVCETLRTIINGRLKQRTVPPPEVMTTTRNVTARHLRETILQVLQQLGGQANVSDIWKEVSSLLPAPPGQEKTCRNRFDQAAQVLKENNQIISPERGVWRLTSITSNSKEST